MATYEITYCNNSLGQVANVSYDTETHEINGFVTGGNSCDYEQPPALFEHNDENNSYLVVPINISPFARLITTPLLTCQVNITLVGSNPSSGPTTADGSATVVATGSGILTYSLDNGASYQPSNVFAGLLPGTYRVTVKNTLSDGQTCTKSQNFTIIAAAVTCNLMLGQIIIGGDNGTDTGSITVETLQNAVKPVEYSLDGDTWGDGAEFTGLPAGNYTIYVRYKDQITCQDNRDVVVGAVTCDLRINGLIKLDESGPFKADGSLQITAASSFLPLTYSIDGGDTFQAYNTFYNLVPGDYTLIVRDDESCESQLLITINRYRPSYFEVPQMQSHRFVKQNSDLPYFDNRLFATYHHEQKAACPYHTKVTFDDLITVQYRSNYSSHVLTVHDATDDTQVDELLPLKISGNLNYSEVLYAYAYGPGGNEVELYFPTGLPEFAAVGQIVSLSGFDAAELVGDFAISQIRAGVGQTAGFEVIVIEVLGVSGLDGGELSAVYDLELYEVYEAPVDWSAYVAGTYYLQLVATGGRYTDTGAISEPVRLQPSHPGTKLFTCRNIENAFGIDYSNGIEHIFRLTAQFNYPEPGGDRATHEDSRRQLIKLQENVTQLVPLRVYQIPYYQFMQLASAFGHDRFTVEGVAFQTDESVEKEEFDHDSLLDLTITLRQVSYIAENADDSGDVDEPITILGANNNLLEVNP